MRAQGFSNFPDSGSGDTAKSTPASSSDISTPDVAPASPVQNPTTTEFPELSFIIRPLTERVPENGSKSRDALA